VCVHFDPSVTLLAPLLSPFLCPSFSACVAVLRVNVLRVTCYELRATSYELRATEFRVSKNGRS